MDVFTDLEELSTNLKKLRDSIYENDIFEDPTETQEETFYKILATLISKTESYIETFSDKNHVVAALADLQKLQNIITTDDINFFTNTMKERLDWYYKNEKKESDGNFIAAADVVILWPLRAIAERMYRILFNKTFDSRFDKAFLEIDEEN